MSASEPRQQRLRQRARQALRPSSPPTHQISLPGHRDAVEERTARAVLDLALRVGAAMLSTGAASADVTAAVLRLAAGHGVTSLQVDVTFTSITLSADRGDDEDPLTLVRVVPLRSADYSRLHELHALVRDASAGEVAVDDARARLDRLARAPHPYRRWVVTLALAVLAAAVCALLGGGWEMLLLTAATTATIDRLLRVLDRRGLPAFFQQAVGAAVPTLVAMGALVVISYTPVTVQGFPPSLIVATGIVVLLAGLGLVGAAQDAIDGYYVTAGARGYEVLLMTVGIVAGVLAVLDVADRFGVPLAISEVPGIDAPPPVQLAAAATVAGAWSVAAYARPKAIAVSAAGGATAWLVVILGTGAGLGPAVSSGLGAAVVGLGAQAVAERLRVPTLAVTMSGVVPLLPGLALYTAMFQLSQAQVTDGLASLVQALAVGIALAAGVSLGAFLGRPLRKSDRWSRRALRRSAGGRQ